MNYTLTDAFGNVLQDGSCAESEFESQALEGQTVHVGAYTHLDYFDLDTQKFVVRPDRPTPSHIWAAATKEWRDPRTLQALRSAKWAEIKQAREAAFTAPLVTPFGIFQADEEGQKNIERAVLLANNLAALDYPVAINFTLHNDSIRVMDALAMVQVGLLLGGRVQLIRAQATVLRVAIDAAATSAAVAAITWSPDA